RAACGLAKDAIRSERRRRERETKAVTRAALDLDPPTSQDAWESVAPLLEDAMRGLNPREQDIIVLRFLENKALQEVGHALDISEDAAQKRIRRALDKLRAHFLRRGLTISGTALAATLVIPSTHASPAGLASSVAP